MKVTKRQLRRIIKEEKARLQELGISRQERDARLDDPDDLTLGVDTYQKIVDHLSQLPDIIQSEAGNQVLDSYSEEVNAILKLLPWAEDMLEYWKEE